MNTGTARKTLILSLIKDDLTNARLVDALNGAGLQAECYYLRLSETIFALMGFAETKETDAVYEKYLALSRKVQGITLAAAPQQLDLLAAEIYAELKKAKR